MADSWLGQLGSWIGSAFGSDAPAEPTFGMGEGTGWNIPGALGTGDPSSSGGSPFNFGSVIPSVTNHQTGDGGWNTSSFLGPLITAGAGLAGQYFTNSQNKDLAEQYAAQQQAYNAEQKQLAEEQMANAKAIAGTYAGATIKAAAIQAGAQKKNTLANLYNNWAGLTEKGGEAEGQDALETGKNMESPIMARLAVLK